jgi:hypothetical protein
LQERLKKTWDVMTGYEKVLEQVLHGVQETKKGLPVKSPGAMIKTWTA